MKDYKNFSILLLVLLLFLGIGISLNVGQVQFSWKDIFSESQEGKYLIFWNIRFPRILLSILVGSNLAIAGVIIQGLFRNPLVEPGLIGVSTGSALAAFACILLLEKWSSEFAYLLQIASFLGAAFITTMIYFLSKKNGKLEILSILLTGIGINAIAGAGIGLMSYLATDSQIRAITFWGLGSLAGANWNLVITLLPVSVVMVLSFLFLGQPLNLLQVGEKEAGHLGLGVQKIKFLLIILVCILVGSSVAVSGSIGFVGLVVPHILRLWMGSDNRYLLIGSALFGAVLLLVADSISRFIVAPAELPIGILTSILGGPVFIYLLRKEFQSRTI